MTGAAGHLVGRAGYGSLIGPGLLLKAEGKLLLPGKEESSAGVLREAKNRPRAKDAPPPRPHLSGSARAPLAPQNRWPGPHLYLSVPPLPGSCGPTASAAAPLSRGTTPELVSGERTPKASHPKERKQKGCSSRRRDIGHAGVRGATRHPCPAPTR